MPGQRRLYCTLCVLVLAGVCACGTKRRTPGLSGPYVQQVTNNTAVVAAITDRPEQLVLRYGPAGGSLGGRVEEPELVEIHGLQATDLAPGGRYGYRLESGGGDLLGSGTFRTAPVGRDAPCVFLALGDSGGTNESQGELVDDSREAIDDLRGASDDENQQGLVAGAMLGRDPDLVLHTGDLVYPDGAREDYPEGFFRPFAPLIANVPIYPTLGNHDVKTEGGRPLLETFFLPRNGPEPDGRAYSFDWGAVHFTCLDVASTPFEAGSAQLTWLARDLARNDAPWRVVFFHVPPFSATREDSDPIVEHVVPILEAGGVDLVLAGHDHVYARFLPRGGTTYVVTGGGGKSLYRVRDRSELAYGESVFHFVEVRVERTSMIVRGVDVAGVVFDEVTIRKE